MTRVVLAVVVVVSMASGCTVRPRPADSGSPTGIDRVDPLPAQSVTPPPTPTASRTPNSLAPGAVVPDVTGKRLGDAAAVLSATGFAQSSIQTRDGDEQNRFVVNYNNWIVRSQAPPSGTPADALTIVTLTVTKPTDGMGDRTAVAGVVPNVVCKDLESAWNLLRAAGFTTVGPTDGTGKQRAIMVYQNWVVIGQSIPARLTIDGDTRIEVTVVKYGEPTGSSGCAS